MFLPESTVQSQRTDGPPALVQAVAGFLQGVMLCPRSCGCIFVLLQQAAETEH